ncbi:MAG: ArgE/DapE family deacylase [Candidatus Woesebacteria bacterium]|nr:MAG: ArgE/DapE family deacylase [Candidatus Woesebacteria bacterium]
MLKKLIQINSVTGMEQGICKYIADLLTSYGVNPVNVKGNVVLVIKGSNSKKCLIFNAHVDTVSPGDVKLWQYDPFGGIEKDGKIFGLGASDNKASIAVLMLLAKEFSVKKPECDVILTFTVGEEVDGHGTNDTVEWLATNHLKTYKKISAIVCEPTGLELIGVAHKGNLFLKITTNGKSGHGSKPIKTNDHSVLKMYKVISNIEKLGKIWKKRYSNEVLGSSTIGLATSIIAGNAVTPNKFPDMCSATFDIRTIPEMHSLAFEVVKRSVGRLGGIEYLYPPVSFGFTESGEDIVKIVKNVSKAKIVAFPGSTDMPFFTERGIPTVIFGPGETDQMHKANEFCYSDKIGKCLEIFKQVVKGYNNTYVD